MFKTRLKQGIVIFVEYLGTGGLIVFSTFVLKRVESQLDIQVISLLYLLPILVCTVCWGLIPGFLAGVLAFFALNYYFIPPLYTLLIHKSQDVITLVVFLVVAVVMSQIIGLARKGTKLAKMREREATEMYELISLLAGITEEQDVASALANKILSTFHCNRVEVVTKSDV